MRSFRPKTGGTQGDDDQGEPPGFDAAADDQPTLPETDPMPRTKPSHRNAKVDFRGEKQLNATHASTTDPDARLYKKASSTGAALCFIGHALMENRNGFIVQVNMTRASGRAERQAAINMIHRHSPDSTRRLPLGADKGYDAAQFVVDLRQACTTPHIAQNCII